MFLVLFSFFNSVLTPVAMAFRKESKNEEGSGCNDGSMDAVEVFLFHASANLLADVCNIFQGQHILNIYTAKGAHLSTSILAGVGGGGGLHNLQLFKALVLVMNYFVISTVMRFIFNNCNNYFIKKKKPCIMAISPRSQAGRNSH